MTENHYWTSIEDLLSPENASKNEFKEEAHVSNTQFSRRDFLMASGYSVLGMTVAGCSRMRPQSLIGYLHNQSDIVPGVANWFASTCQGCSANCGTLVKTREGRPIKIEGNSDSVAGRGGLCSVGHASVLSLYDSYRFHAPRIAGKESTWAELDQGVVTGLQGAVAAKKKITLLTASLASPTALAAIALFKQKFGNVEHVVYEGASRSAIADAFEFTHGHRGIPEINFESLHLLVSFDADFLGTWIDPVVYAKNYSAARDLEKGSMLRHIQVESWMSLSGSNADKRILVKPSEISQGLKHLTNYLAQRFARADIVEALATTSKEPIWVESIGRELMLKKDKVLLISGSNVLADQICINLCNEMLGADTKTVKLIELPEQRIENDAQFERFIEDCEKGLVGAVVIAGPNPLYTYADPERFIKALAKVATKISLAQTPDETSGLCNLIAPDHHALESWADFANRKDFVSIGQPVIEPLFNTRQAWESLLVWSGDARKYRIFMREEWSKKYHKSSIASFDAFWDKSVEDGFYKASFAAKIYSSQSRQKKSDLKAFLKSETTPQGKWEFVTYQKIAMRDGRHANNPWLQELPDAITKTSWENYLQISVIDAKELTLVDGDVVELKNAKVSLKLPVLVQPGQMIRCVAIAVGYGRKTSGKVGQDVGANAFELTRWDGKNYVASGSNFEIKKTLEKVTLAKTQTNHSIESRNIFRETDLKSYRQDQSAGNFPSAPLMLGAAVAEGVLQKAESQATSHEGHEHPKEPAMKSLWTGHEYKENSWALAIDLNKCTGCSACVVSCQAENNIPVVGKQEVINSRDMYWMRLDRYYKGDMENPEVVHQPMLCQHCDNAPCETVCPVIATTHSSEGLNQQVYNRCIGTRYCANNCPYKVRRFNWFDYPHEDPLARMVLNPDVVVRSRGVMEKCSMCVQRIQETKLVAKKDGRKILDGELKTACQQSCPSDAIVFGNRNDPESKLRKAEVSPRRFGVLEELNVKPRISYLTKVRNKDGV